MKTERWTGVLPLLVAGVVAVTPGISAAAAPPVADAGGPYTINEGSGVTLDGTASAAGSGATFEWDIDGDGQFDDATGSNPAVSAATLAMLGLGDGPTGPVAVSLQVTDDGLSDVDTTTLAVVNVAPVVSVTSVPSGVVAGNSAPIDLGASDPSVADMAATFTWRIDWGDGSPVQVVTAGFDVQVSHFWATNGTFTVTVTATDKDQGTSAASTAAVIVGPVVVPEAGGPYTIAEGDNLVLAGSATGAGPSATFAWDLDADAQFDDASGATPTLTPIQLAALGLADGPAGPVVFTLRVVDGASVATDTATYSITNAAPSATVDLPASIVAGTATTVKFGAQDPSPTDQPGQFVYRIDWDGDGTVDDTVTGPSDRPVSHTYASAGTVNSSVVAVDKDSDASAPTVVSVAVSPAAAGTPPGTGSLPATGTHTMPIVVVAVTMILVALILLVGVRILPYTRRRDEGSHR